MNTSPILTVGTRIVLPACLLLSIVILWRGHNAPGGGFVGGLIAAAGIACHALVHGRHAVLGLLRLAPESIAGLGLVVASLSGLPALMTGAPFLTHQWLVASPGFAVGTALVFDIGVYLAVVGAVLTLLIRYLEKP